MLIMLGKVKESVDFYLAKGVVDRVAEKLNIKFDYRAGQIQGLHQVEQL